MAQFTALKLTKAGYDLQAKTQAGTQLTFTRVALGDGELSTGTDLTTLSALISEKQSSQISSVTVNNGSAEIKVNFSNQGLTEGYYLRELGVFAEDANNGQPILYAVANAGDAADYIPAYGGAETIEQIFTIELATGNEANVTAEFAESIYVLKAGDTMTGLLTLSGDPVSNLGAATKQYVDTLSAKSLANYLPLAGGKLTGALNENLVSIPAASTTDIGSANGNIIQVTGTATITSLGIAPAGARRTVIFGGSLTLTYNANSLILPGGVSVPTRPGDVATFVSLGNGSWLCIDYQPNSDLAYQQVAVTGTSILVLSNDISRAFSSSSSYRSGSYTKSFIVKRPGTYTIYCEVQSPSGVAITVSSNYGTSTYTCSNSGGGCINTSFVPAASTITVTATIPGGLYGGYTGYIANCRLYVGSWLATLSDMVAAT